MTVTASALRRQSSGASQWFHEVTEPNRREDYLRPNSSELDERRRKSADPHCAFALVRAGFLDERGVRWTPTIPLSTGRFGVRVPGGAHTRTGPYGPVLGVSGTDLP
jgi:hypothetical protein